jgi:hypothetical protein
MVPSRLSAPLGSLQAATATVESELKLIFPVLADAVGCSLPTTDFSEFMSTVKEYESDSQQIKQMTRHSPLALTDGLSPHELAALVEIAEQTFAPNEKIAVRWIRESLEKTGYRGVAVALALKMLARKDLVEIRTESDSYNNDEYAAVHLTDEGWQWLEANQDKIALTTSAPKSSDGAPKPEDSSEDIPF